MPILGPDRRSRRPLQRETRWEAEVRDWPLDRVIVFRARAWRCAPPSRPLPRSRYVPSRYGSWLTGAAAAGLGRGEARSEWSSKGRSRVQKWYTREQAARDSLEKCAPPYPHNTPRTLPYTPLPAALA
eukprot:COSAG04_NODE_499_length_13372_cov_8.292398_3_plen_128_part_00